jgi:glycosyltransferase involved in cell wall biosynthesis
MRVLWFTNDPMPAVNERLGRPTTGTAHWIPSLLESLRVWQEIQVEVATVFPGAANIEFEERGVKYFLRGQPKLPGMYFQCRRRDLEWCINLVRDRMPDLIHIHGTERFYGILPSRKLIGTPCVVSIQGLLSGYLPLFFGALSPREVLRSNRLIELATLRGLLWLQREYARGAKYEQEILAGPSSFLGRTDWDRAYVMAANPAAKYYHVGEILRPTFKDFSWDLSKCEPHTVLFTNCGHPRRGTEILLRAMQIVRREFPNAKLRLAGHIGKRRGYDRFLRRKIAESGSSDSIELLGYLNPNELGVELTRAHVFAISSYAENSPNSLCEAMQVGVPCVAAYSGGIPSLVEHGRTGLLFPRGEAPVLADSIIRIFRDDDLARRISRAARVVAAERHDPPRIISQLLEAYNAAAGISHNIPVAVAVH